MSKLQGRNLVGLFVALTLAAGSASATNGYYTTGTGTKSKAQAGAGTANPQEVMSLATNPANIAFVPDSIDAGLSIFSPMRDYETSPSLANGNGGAGALTAGRCGRRQVPFGWPTSWVPRSPPSGCWARPRAGWWPGLACCSWPDRWPC